MWTWPPARARQFFHSRYLDSSTGKNRIPALTFHSMAQQPAALCVGDIDNSQILSLIRPAVSGLPLGTSALWTDFHRTVREKTTMSIAD